MNFILNANDDSHSFVATKNHLIVINLQRYFVQMTNTMTIGYILSSVYRSVLIMIVLQYITLCVIGWPIYLLIAMRISLLHLSIIVVIVAMIPGSLSRITKTHQTVYIVMTSWHGNAFRFIKRSKLLSSRSSGDLKSHGAHVTSP